MARILSVAGVAVAVAALMVPRPALSQDHVDAPGQAHSHLGDVVSCETLAMPPWSGLPDADRLQFAKVREAMSAYNTAEAAIAAGFRPALGDIPGMGVHYVNGPRGRDGVDIDAPDHLMFIDVDGQPQLVGAAYAFVDVPNTQEPIPYESHLAQWHDHPQFAQDGQTLHMLHLWFVPSSNGPFAGLNFFLPYRTAGIEPPSSCWMADEEDAARIRTVSFALVPPRRPAARQQYAERQAARADMLAALDAAAIAGDHDAWVAAADRFIADLTAAERTAVEATLSTLGANQMSSAQRDAAGVAQPGSGRPGN